jgi:hypothetical protein
MIKTVKPFGADEYGANTFVRMAYKAFQMELKHSFGQIDPTRGTLAKSQKEKFDKMKEWDDSPFHEYQCNKCRNHFTIKKRHEKLRCASCTTAWANSKCANKMCKKCCVHHTTLNTSITSCKVKSHK